ncbi:MAG: PKD domain-containing protein [Bacteroidia bacterium]
MKTRLLLIAILFCFSSSALFSQNATSVCLGDTVFFNSGLKYYSTYLWNFGDGNNSYDEKPYHIYNQ